jgi:serine phosphatase RsbU (regulator of sigma subunit)
MRGSDGSRVDGASADGRVPSALAPSTLDPTDPLIAHLAASPGATRLDLLKIRSPIVDTLRAAGVELAVPVVGERALLAVLGVGPRLSGLDYSPDDRRLLATLAAQAAPPFRVAELINQARLETVQREQMEQELRLAGQIQRSLLPRVIPRLPGWEISVSYKPARAVGGDFYDFLPLPDGRWAIVIGDVTDKGMPAALFMAATRSIIRAVGLRETSPSAVLSEVNDVLCLDIPANMFVTCLYSILDPRSGRLHYANAGHVPLYHRGAGHVAELATGDFPLGVLRSNHYEEYDVVLAHGDEILFSSDGLVEAHNLTQEIYGFPRLLRQLASNSDSGRLIEALLRDLGNFSGPEAESEDDLTLVTVRRLTPSDK